MDKLDLVLLPFIYVLRMTSPLFLLAGSKLCHFYDYWFHTCENATLCADLLVWLQFLACHVSCISLCVVHILLKLIVVLVQFLPLWGAFAFWPQFYWGILTNPNRRLLEICFWFRAASVHCWTALHLFLIRKSTGFWLET